MTTLVFEIYGVDANASEVFRRIADAAQDSGKKIEDTGNKTDEAGKKASSSAGMFAGLTSGWAMLIPVAIPLGAAVLNLSGVLGLVPAAAAFAGASLLTLKLGFQGITEAIGLFNTAQDAADANTNQAAAQRIAAANAAISADQAVKASRIALSDAIRNANNADISSNEAVANAKQALDNAMRSAALNNIMALQGEQHAEEALTNAQNAAARAQQSLTDARQAAKRSLEDVKDRVVDSALAQRSAIEQLENAQRALSAPVGPNQAPKDMEALQLAVDQAQQQVHRMDVEYQRATEDAQTAAAKGIEGASGVVNAQSGVTSAVAAQRAAQTSLGDAQAKVVETQRAGLQSIGDATQKLGDATRAQQQTAIAGAESVTKANLAIDAALRSQQQTLAQNAAAVDTAVGSLHAYNAALAELSPNAAAVVVAITGLRERWQDLQNFVSQRMFAGIGADITMLAGTYLPILQTGLGGIAAGFNTAFQGIAVWLAQRDTIAQFKQIFADFGVTAQNMGASLRPILQILGDLVQVGASFLPGLSGGFAGAAQSVADFVRNAKDSGQLKQWMQTGLDTLQQLWAVFKDLVGIAKDLFGGSASGSGASFLGIVKDITGSVKWLLDTFPILGPIIAIALGAAGLIGFANSLGIIRGATLAWQAAQWLVNAAMDANPIGLIILAIAAVAGLAYLVWKNWEPILGFFKSLWGGITDVFWGTVSRFSEGWNQITRGFWAAIDGVVGAWNWLNSWLGGLGSRIGSALYGIWAPLWDGFRAFVNLIIRGWDSLHFGIPSMDIFGVKIGGFDIGVPQIPFLAEGGLITQGGVAMVGERGPERVLLPTGAQVMPNTASQQAPQQPSTVNVRLEVVANDTRAGQFVMALVRDGIRASGSVTAALGPVA